MIDEADPHHFEFDLDEGIRAQVIEKLETSPPLPLIPGIGPSESGVYALYFRDALVYVGKASKETTKSGRNLRGRLSEHRIKISSRTNIRLDDVRVRYLTFSSEWWVFAAEYALIVHYKPAWNYSGFGSKTPGKGRPGTNLVSSWDQQFPRRAITDSP